MADRSRYRRILGSGDTEGLHTDNIVRTKPTPAHV